MKTGNFKSIMKKIAYNVLLIATMYAATACTKDVQTPGTTETGEQIIFTAVAPGYTKTVIENDNSVYWSPNDEIKICYGADASGKFTSTNTTPIAATTFSGYFDNFEGSIDVGGTANDFWAVYPYSNASSCDGNSVTVQVCSAQKGMIGTFAPGMYPIVARSQNLLLPFRNLCGGVRFTVNNSDIRKVVFKGNDGEVLAGNFKVGMNSTEHPVVLSVLNPETEVSITAPDGGCFVPGEPYYIVLRPIELSKGFTMTFVNSSGSKIYTHDAPVEVKRSVFGVLDGKDDLAIVTDLSADGTANCYIVSHYGQCKFDASKKGHTSESVGTIASAEVLWESFGNADQPEIGDIVKNVSVQDGIVSFTASGKDGNAVIAVKNASDEILWSWHIWVCKDFDPYATAHIYHNNAGTVMDRNLGATSATKGDVKTFGLLYQWGRKDPFLASRSISSEKKAKSTITWPSPLSSDESRGTIDYVIKHPTTFLKYNTQNRDWYYMISYTDNTRWNSEKGMYDPCPKGWKVPEGDKTGLWAKAIGSSSSFSHTFSMGMDFTGIFCDAPEVYYPAVGWIGNGMGTLGTVGSSGTYWSCTPYNNDAYVLYFNHDSRVYVTDGKSRSMGYSVRCVKEDTADCM